MKAFKSRVVMLPFRKVIQAAVGNGLISRLTGCNQGRCGAADGSSDEGDDGFESYPSSRKGQDIQRFLDHNHTDVTA